MKELKQKPEINDSTPQKSIPVYLYKSNFWKLAQRHYISGTVKRANYMTEHYFKTVIAEVKHLYAPLTPIVFERDYRECTGEYSSAMHTFASHTFYFDLDCSYAMEYWFTYDFHNCPFEAEIVALIQRLFAVNTQSKWVHKPETFLNFNNQIAEDKAFYYTLQAD